MAVVSLIPGFLDNLRTQLLARAGLDDVEIVTGAVAETLGKDAIRFLSVRSDTDWGMLGNRRIDEEFTVDGVLYAYSRKKGEAGIKEARDRAYVMFNEIIQQLRTDPEVNSAVRLSRVASHETDQDYTPDFRWARIGFQIIADGHLIP